VKRDRIMVAAGVAMMLALLTLLVCLLVPSPRTMGVLLGVGMPLAVVGVLVFVLYVFRDLRARGVL
jgi:hypothetical protein